MVRVAKGPEQRLHDRLTDTQALGGAPLDALTLRLDTSSRFYVFDQNLTERTSVFGARIGRACLPDPSVVGAAATAWCHPQRSDGALPPVYCGQRPASAPRIPLQALGQYCFHNGGGQSVMALCPQDRCSTRCDLHIPGECIQLNQQSNPFGSSYGVWGAYHREQPVEWAQLPYTLGDDGGDERVALTTPAGVPWGHPVRAVRNYDLGACGAFVTYEALAQLVEEQFHPQIAGELFSDTGVDWIDALQTRVDAGPWLRGVSFTTEDEVGMHFSVRASVEPFGTAGINGLPWGDVYGQLRVGTVPVYTSEGGTVRAIEGARRLSVEGHFEAANDWNAPAPPILDARRNISDNIARGLQGSAAAPGFPEILADTVHRLFLLPISPPGGSAIRCRPSDIGTEAGRTYCETQIVPFDTLASGPEFGCHAVSEFSAANQRALAKASDRCAFEAGTVSGVCATRLQAQRVNLLPDALEVVLSEGPDDNSIPGRAGRNSMREFLRFVLATMPSMAMPSMASESGFRLSCDDRADWNAAQVPGRIAATGTLRDPAFASKQCTERTTCEALRPADAQPMGMPCPSP